MDVARWDVETESTRMQMLSIKASNEETQMGDFVIGIPVDCLAVSFA
jgi:hypothetical protein